jgi:hypothetical protein
VIIPLEPRVLDYVRFVRGFRKKLGARQTAYHSTLRVPQPLSPYERATWRAACRPAAARASMAVRSYLEGTAKARPMRAH